MSSPSLELVNDCHIYLSGDVVVHPSAAIAPGVLLQADPGSRLTVAAGVCIGQGVVLHANQGQLVIEAGATLGSGVLIVGRGKIGSNACIGALTTIINGSVEPNQIVPPRSLLGETGRQIAATPNPSPQSHPSQPESSPSNFTPHPPTSPSPPPPTSPPARKSPTPVYGQAYVERFMITMFPHRRSFEDSDSPPAPSSGQEAETPNTHSNPPPS
ncbi:MAG: hypothetical protein ACKO7W_06430 [Elainella sp.]